ncbi:hypothetical protein J6TS2_15830 [Heyndrickxia sporothermodurans]|nr:hypothetical protein J6TS2_15830 [Heyndrickxia sporothermodurans]
MVLIILKIKIIHSIHYVSLSNHSNLFLINIPIKRKIIYPLPIIFIQNEEVFPKITIQIHFVL